MRRFVVILTALAVLVVLIIGATILLSGKLRSAIMDEVTAQRCTVTGASNTVSLTAEQAQMTSIIVAASMERELPERAAVIALATAYQESGIRNLDYGDRDSLGLFQQRPDPRFEWGTAEEIMDPWYSSLRFYEELVKFPGWESADINDQAQAVQRSGFPEAYRQHIPNATTLADAARGVTQQAVTCAAPGTSVDTAPLEELLGHIPGISVSTAQGEISITSDDPQTLWAAAQLALLNNYQTGIASIDVAGATYRPGDAEWAEDGSAPADTAIIRF